jgi:hypothetical protein
MGLVQEDEEGSKVASIKYDVSDVESGGGAEQPQPALYKGKIVTVTHRTKNVRGEAVNDLEVVVDVGDDFARLWTYIQLDNPATKWKLREFTDAMGLPARGAIDPTKLKNKPVTVKVSADTDLDGNYRGRVKNLFKPGEEPSENGASATASAEGDDEPLSEEELADWDNDDLKEELEARGIKLAGRFSSAKAIEAILEAQGTNGEPEEEDEDESEDEDEAKASSDIDPELLEDLKTDPEHYADWADDDLKTYIEELGISGNLTGRKTRSKMIEHITQYAEQAGGGGEEGDGAPEDDYEEWPDQDLKDEVATRIEQGAAVKIVGRQTKAKLIEALRKDDRAGEPF